MEAIKDSYGSYRNFVAAFDDAAAGHFASGWAWLVKNNNGTVEVGRRARETKSDSKREGGKFTHRT